MIQDTRTLCISHMFAYTISVIGPYDHDDKVSFNILYMYISDGYIKLI